MLVMELDEGNCFSFARVDPEHAEVHVVIIEAKQNIRVGGINYEEQDASAKASCHSSINPSCLILACTRFCMGASGRQDLM